jgi:hypothetical protein
MTVQDKIELLKKIVPDDQTLNLVLDKLIGVIQEQYLTQLSRYRTDLQSFENRYGISSQEFYVQFEEGQLGDDMDFFEWAGLFELEQRLLEKINYLENA